MNNELKALLEWYVDNGVLDFVDKKSANHFVSNQKQNNKSESENKFKISKSNASRNTGDIAQLLALKYNNNKNNDLDKSILTPQEATNLAREAADKTETLEELKSEIEKFEGCYSIKKLATNMVFGEGNTNANILIIGEAPGNNEDLQGRPFCGQSGALLNKMFEAIGYKRETLYITNMLFWRPPGNRTPTPEEIAMCKPFVEKHIALINPKVIIMMGATALQGLINTTEGITKARGRFFNYSNKYLKKNINAIALFHPSYLLRTPIKKRDTWKDLLIIRDFLIVKE
jgi:uracil-DNA glycosylase